MWNFCYPQNVSPRKAILGLWYGTVVSSMLATIFISYVMLRDVGWRIPFSWHPILMTFSFLIFMTQGIHSYLVGFGPLLLRGRGGESTTRGNDDANNSSSDLTTTATTATTTNHKSVSRNIHGILMMVALITAIGGYVAIFVAHSNGKGHTAVGDPVIKEFHTWFGYLILIGVGIQCCVGASKYILLKTKSQKFAKWHGKIGPILWLAGCVNVFSGVWFWSSTTYNLFLQTMTIISVVLTGSVTILFFEIRPNEILNDDRQHDDTGATMSSLL